MAPSCSFTESFSLLLLLLLLRLLLPFLLWHHSSFFLETLSSLSSLPSSYKSSHKSHTYVGFHHLGLNRTQRTKNKWIVKNQGEEVGVYKTITTFHNLFLFYLVRIFWFLLVYALEISRPCRHFMMYKFFWVFS